MAVEAIEWFVTYPGILQQTCVFV